MSIHDNEYIVRGRRYRLSKQISAKHVITKGNVTMVDLSDPLRPAVTIARSLLPEQMIEDARMEYCPPRENDFNATKKSVRDYIKSAYNEDICSSSTMDGLLAHDQQCKKISDDFVDSFQKESEGFVKKCVRMDEEKARVIVDALAPYIMSMIIEEAKNSGLDDYQIAELRMTGEFGRMAYLATMAFAGLKQGD